MICPYMHQEFIKELSAKTYPEYPTKDSSDQVLVERELLRKLASFCTETEEFLQRYSLVLRALQYQVLS